jgi:nucleoside-diphosphate-sugar epimerase
MKLLLTGASGFLGSIISSSLSHNSIITLSRFNAEINVDLSKEVPKLPDVDLVIHAAGKAHIIPSSKIEYQEFFDINVTGTINLLKGLEQSTLPKSIIYISSVSVYGREKGLLINEDEPLLAKDPYGVSKIKAEKIIIEWCKTNKVICGILRVPLIVGVNSPGNLGSMIKGIQKRYYFNIAGGKAKKSMVLSGDLVKSIIKVAEIGGIYNLTDGYHPSFSEISNHISIRLGKQKPMNMPLFFARIIAKFGDLIGSKAPLNTNKLKKITSDLTFDDSKAREAFGWDPTPVLKGFKIHE